MVKPVIWVEGLIAAGKSRLTEQLSKLLGYRSFPEPVADKGYLELFYEDPKRWAFSLQIEMLRRRREIHQLAMLECRCGTARGCLLDRGMPGDRVFARLHYQAGNIHQLEWDTYEALYNDFMSIPHLQPTLLVYLDVTPEVALERINGRGRPGEEAIQISYLSDLTLAYESLLREIETGKHAWANGMDVLRILWSARNLPAEPIAYLIQEALYAKHKPPPFETPADLQRRLEL